MPSTPASRKPLAVATTRPPAVYRGNPFQIEVGLAYGGDLGPDPKTADSTMSRTKPTIRDSSVKKPTVAMERPRLKLQLQPPQCCHHRVPYSLPVAAGDVMAGINRYRGRSRVGRLFHWAFANRSSVSRSCATSFL